MSEPSANSTTAKPLPISRQAVSLAHAIESQCTTPGRWQITLEVGWHGRDWESVEISRVEPVRRVDVDKKKKP